jgi:hypothetical protein
MKKKTVIFAVLLALPCTWMAISVSDNAAIPDSIRYLLSPGTMLGKLVFLQPAHNGSTQVTHSWHETIDQLLGQIRQWFAIVFFTDMVFYSMLIFGCITATRAFIKSK